VKICDLTQFYSPVSGGVRRYIEQKAAYVRRHRPGDQHILAVPGAETTSTGDDVCRVYTIASPLISRTARYRVLLHLHLIDEILQQEKPDIIESGDPYQLAWKTIASGEGLGIPVVGFYHSHFPEALLRSVDKFTSPVILAFVKDMAQRYVKSLYNRFSTTFVPSPALADVLTAWNVQRVTPVDLGVDIDVFYPDATRTNEVRHRYGIPANHRLLLYVGRLAPEKNVQTLFDAFSLLAPENLYHLLVLGDGTLRPALKRLIKSSGHTSWEAYCPNPHELADLYRAADLFVHPGIQETFGLVTLESQASGTPVVGIRGSYMDRIVLTNQMAWATENTPEALAEAIRKKFTTDLYERGLQASAGVRERFSWKSAFDRIFSNYETIIETYRRNERGWED